MMLCIPLRARLTTPVQNAHLHWRLVLAALRCPRGSLLLDYRQPKLPPLPRTR